MQVVADIPAVRRVRRADPSAHWGLVPTMGALHEGHLSLVRRARTDNARVGVSIFVNPAQFHNPDDLTTYPRDPERDLALLKQEGVDLVWTPSPDQVYPAGYQTYIDVEEASRPLEGSARPGHFRGVATVVAKLMNVFQPQRVYFGQKDAQQVAVVRRMVDDLNFPLLVVSCPTVREPDGLAMSSRNVLLSPQARPYATCLIRALQAAGSAFAQGERRAPALCVAMRQVIHDTPMTRIDYVSVANPQSLAELEAVETTALLSLAVFVGKVRLIDNIVVGQAACVEAV
jgi:pantoate--beta-alanine ligase